MILRMIFGALFVLTSQLIVGQDPKVLVFKSSDFLKKIGGGASAGGGKWVFLSEWQKNTGTKPDTVLLLRTVMDNMQMYTYNDNGLIMFKPSMTTTISAAQGKHITELQHSA